MPILIEKAIEAVIDFIVKHWRMVAIGILATVVYVETSVIRTKTAELSKTQTALVQANAATAAANKLTAATEQARKQDQANAQASYDALHTLCAQGFAAALKKGRTIERIITQPAPASGGRGLVDPGSLRDAIEGDAAAGPDASAPAVPAGGDQPHE